MLNLRLQMYTNGITIVDTGSEYLQSLHENSDVAGVMLHYHQVKKAYFTSLGWCKNEIIIVDIDLEYLQLLHKNPYAADSGWCTNRITIIDIAVI